MKKFSILRELGSVVRNTAIFATGFTLASSLYIKSKRDKNEFLTVLAVCAGFFCAINLLLIPFAYLAYKISESREKKREKKFNEQNADVEEFLNIDDNLLSEEDYASEEE